MTLLDRKVWVYHKLDGRLSERTPECWLKRLEDASRHRLEDLKSGGVKRTLKVNLSPWGEVCQSEFKWKTKHIFISPFRRSRGERMWAYSEELLQQQIPVPEPLLYIEEQRALFVTRTFMVFKWMALGPNLVFQMINPGSRASDMFTILKTAVGTVARFHNAGFIHGDLKWGNLFSDKKKTQRVILTDLEGVQRTKSSLRQGIDLARFILDGVRFRLDQQELNRLIACYLQGREAVGPFLKMGLRWRVLQKRTRYIKQGAPD